MKHISFTFRPLYSEFLKYPLEKFTETLTSIKAVTRYYVGCEKGGDEKITHYQCWVEISNRPDTFSSSLRKKLELEPRSNAYKCNTINENKVNYVLGYCMKENLEFLTNIEKEYRENAWAEYLKMSKYDKKVVDSIVNPNQFIAMVLDEHIKLNETQFCDLIYQDMIHDVNISFMVYSRMRYKTVRDFVNMKLNSRNPFHGE